MKPKDKFEIPIKIKHQVKPVKVIKKSNSILEKVDEQEEIENPKVRLRMCNMTMATSYMAFHQNRNVFEDRQRKKTYSTKKYLEVMYRLKLLYLNLERLKYVQKFIFYYDYPKFSKFCFFLFLILSYFANPEHFASYGILFLILCVVAYSSPY